MSKPKAKGRSLDHTTDNLTISLVGRTTVMLPPEDHVAAVRVSDCSQINPSLSLLPSSTSLSPSISCLLSSHQDCLVVIPEPAHRHLKYIRALSTGMIWLPAKGRVAMLVKPTDIVETAQDDGEHCSDTDAGADPFDIHLLDAKLQLKLEQKMKMKLPKWVRLRRKKLVHKRRMRKKGRWPRSKTK